MYPYSSCVQNDERTSLVLRTREGMVVYSGAGADEESSADEQPFRIVTECVNIDRTTREVSAIVHSDGESFPVTVRFDGDEAWVHTPTGSVCVREIVPVMGHAGGKEEGITQLTAPIPGRVASIAVEVGDSVSAGTAIVVLDSMKMEHPIRVPLDAVVTSLPVRVGMLVQGGAVLVELRGSS
jgi:acetyl/propionyl-CoA carboxylase alpha subunit